MRARGFRWAVGVAVTLSAAGIGAQGAPDPSLVVTTQWLAAHLNDPGVVLIHVERADSLYRAGHIKGARFVLYADYTPEVNGLRAELPAPDAIQRIFEAVGVSDNSHVVLTGPPLVATRAFFTLDYAGHRHVSMLDGGLTKWRAEGGAVETGAPPAVTPGRFTVRPRPEIVVSSDFVLARAGKKGTSIIDTRTEAEYNGTQATGTTASVGHVDGARRLEWQDMFTTASEFSLKGTDELRKLWTERVAPGDTVIAYCTVGYRGSGSYFMSRLLGYPVRLYDGSYEDWSKKQLPVVKAATPLRTP